MNTKVNKKASLCNLLFISPRIVILRNSSALKYFVLILDRPGAAWFRNVANCENRIEKYIFATRCGSLARPHCTFVGTAAFSSNAPFLNSFALPTPCSGNYCKLQPPSIFQEELFMSGQLNILPTQFQAHLCVLQVSRIVATTVLSLYRLVGCALGKNLTHLLFRLFDQDWRQSWQKTAHTVQVRKWTIN